MPSGRKKNPVSTHRVGFSIDEREYEALRAKAHLCGVSISWLTKQALLEFLARHKEDDLRLPLVTPDGELVERD